MAFLLASSGDREQPVSILDFREALNSVGSSEKIEPPRFELATC
jgi:hypothetical protein